MIEVAIPVQKRSYAVTVAEFRAGVDVEVVAVMSMAVN